jgi:hypothetical protein
MAAFDQPFDPLKKKSPLDPQLPRPTPTGTGGALAAAPPVSLPPSPEPNIPRPVSPQLSALNSTLGDFNQAGQRADAMQERARQIPIPAPIIREGHGTVTSTPMPGTNAAMLANQTLGARMNAEREQQVLLAPKLDALSNQVRQQSAQTRAQTAQRQANALLAGVGVSGIPTTPTPLPRPNFSNVVGNAATTATPARPLVSGTLSGAQGSPGVGAAPSSQPSLKPGDVNTFTGSNGVTRPVPGMLSQASGGGVPAQSFGGLAMPTLAAPVAPAFAAPRQDMSVSVPRPVRADAYNVREASDQNKQIADTLQSEIFRNSLAAGRGSRSARSAQADMLQTLAQLGGKQLDVAANVAGGDRDAAVGTDRVGLEQIGANQRALLADTGATTRTGMLDSGETNRSVLKSLAELKKPTQVTDASGNLLQVTGTSATPVLGADGKPVTLDSPQREASRKALQEAYAKLGESATAFLPPGITPTDADIGTARIRAAQIAGYGLKQDKSGAMFVQIDGEWMPL